MNIRAITGTRLILVLFFFILNLVIIKNVWLKSPVLNAANIEADFQVPEISRFPLMSSQDHGLIPDKYPYLEIGQKQAITFIVDLRDSQGILRGKRSVLAVNANDTKDKSQTAVLKDEIFSLDSNAVERIIEYQHTYDAETNKLIEYYPRRSEEIIYIGGELSRHTIYYSSIDSPVEAQGVARDKIFYPYYNNGEATDSWLPVDEWQFYPGDSNLERGPRKQHDQYDPDGTGYRDKIWKWVVNDAGEEELKELTTYYLNLDNQIHKKWTFYTSENRLIDSRALIGHWKTFIEYDDYCGCALLEYSYDANGVHDKPVVFAAGSSHSPLMMPSASPSPTPSPSDCDPLKRCRVYQVGASWCGPCRILKPKILAEVAKYSCVRYEYIDVSNGTNGLPKWKKDFLGKVGYPFGIPKVFIYQSPGGLVYSGGSISAIKNILKSKCNCKCSKRCACKKSQPYKAGCYADKSFPRVGPGAWADEKIDKLPKCIKESPDCDKHAKKCKLSPSPTPTPSPSTSPSSSPSATSSPSITPLPLSFNRPRTKITDSWYSWLK